MSTHAYVIGSSGDSILQDSGIIDFVGKTTSDPCFIKNARLLPETITHTVNDATITLDLKSNNNFHIEASVNIGTLDLTNVIKGQSGHIIISNEVENDHSSIIWKIDNTLNYIKWQGGSAPTLSSNNDYVDVLSYYVFSSTCVLMVASTAYY
jgi:hypothetical protein